MCRKLHDQNRNRHASSWQVPDGKFAGRAVAAAKGESSMGGSIPQWPTRSAGCVQHALGDSCRGGSTVLGEGAVGRSLKMASRSAPCRPSSVGALLSLRQGRVLLVFTSCRAGWLSRPGAAPLLCIISVAMSSRWSKPLAIASFTSSSPAPHMQQACSSHMQAAGIHQCMALLHTMASIRFAWPSAARTQVVKVAGEVEVGQGSDAVALDGSCICSKSSSATPGNQHAATHGYSPRS